MHKGLKRPRESKEGEPPRPSCDYGIFAHKPIVYLIMNLLPIISQMALLRAIPKLRALLGSGWSIHERFTRQLHALVQGMLDKGKSPITAREVLNATSHYGHAPLTGSAVLSALWGNVFEPGDLDFVKCGTAYDHNPCEMVKEHGAHYHSGNVWTTNQLYDNLSQEYINTVLNVDLSLNSFNGDADPDRYCTPNPLAQCICVKTPTPEDYVRTCFDLRFLCNLYDTQRLRVMNPFAVLRRESALDVSRYCQPAEECAVQRWRCRYECYTKERGFAIYPMIRLTDEQLRQRYQAEWIRMENKTQSLMTPMGLYCEDRVREWKRDVFDVIHDACK